MAALKDCVYKGRRKSGGRSKRQIASKFRLKVRHKGVPAQTAEGGVVDEQIENRPDDESAAHQYKRQTGLYRKTDAGGLATRAPDQEPENYVKQTERKDRIGDPVDKADDGDGCAALQAEQNCKRDRSAERNQQDRRNKLAQDAFKPTPGGASQIS